MGATTASGAAVSTKNKAIRLRDASNETLKNSEPTNDKVINPSAKSSTA
jgi:hypothetical protein